MCPRIHEIHRAEHRVHSSTHHLCHSSRQGSASRWLKGSSSARCKISNTAGFLRIRDLWPLSRPVQAIPHMDHHYVSKMFAIDDVHFMDSNNPECYNYSSDSRRVPLCYILHSWHSETCCARARSRRAHLEYLFVLLLPSLSSAKATAMCASGSELHRTLVVQAYALLDFAAHSCAFLLECAVVHAHPLAAGRLWQSLTLSVFVHVCAVLSPVPRFF